MLNIYMGVVLSVVCLLLLDPILRFFGASDATLPYARQYMVIILAGNVVTHTYLGLNAVLRAASKPRQAMNATIFTVVVNTILDPIFIYPWGLGLGISGAAYATILAQVLALCYQLRLLSDKRELIHFRRGTYRLHSQIVKSIISIGISPFAMNVCSCIIVIFINNQLVHYGGDLSVGAYGISNKILFIFVMFVIGLNQGMQPIAGYNYGAQKFDRLMHVVKLTMLSATAVMTVGWCLAIFMPRLCVRLFTTDATLINLSANALRIMCCMFPIVGYQMVVTNFFQCIGKVKVSIFLSLSRQLIFLLPMLWLLPHLFQLNGVWFSMPASDLLASLVTAWIMARYMRKFMRQQQEKETA